MSIPVQISLELLRYGDEGEPAFCLTLDLLNANGKSLTAAIDVDYKWENPTISNEVDFLGLQDHDRRALILAAYEKMVRFHGAGPTGGVIQYSRWVVPDISDWVRRSLYHAASERILRTMRRLQPAGAGQAPIKEFTESVEEAVTHMALYAKAARMSSASASSIFWMPVPVNGMDRQQRCHSSILFRSSPFNCNHTTSLDSVRAFAQTLGTAASRLKIEYVQSPPANEQE